MKIQAIAVCAIFLLCLAAGANAYDWLDDSSSNIVNPSTIDQLLTDVPNYCVHLYTGKSIAEQDVKNLFNGLSDACSNSYRLVIIYNKEQSKLVIAMSTESQITEEQLESAANPILAKIDAGNYDEAFTGLIVKIHEAAAALEEEGEETPEEEKKPVISCDFTINNYAKITSNNVQLLNENGEFSLEPFCTLSTGDIVQINSESKTDPQNSEQKIRQVSVISSSLEGCTEQTGWIVERFAGENKCTIEPYTQPQAPEGEESKDCSGCAQACSGFMSGGVEYKYAYCLTDAMRNAEIQKEGFLGYLYDRASGNAGCAAYGYDYKCWCDSSPINEIENYFCETKEAAPAAANAEIVSIGMSPKQAQISAMTCLEATIKNKAQTTQEFFVGFSLGTAENKDQNSEKGRWYDTQGCFDDNGNPKSCFEQDELHCWEGGQDAPAGAPTITCSLENGLAKVNIQAGQTVTVSQCVSLPDIGNPFARDLFVTLRYHRDNIIKKIFEYDAFKMHGLDEFNAGCYNPSPGETTYLKKIGGYKIVAESVAGGSAACSNIAEGTKATIIDFERVVYILSSYDWYWKAHIEGNCQKDVSVIGATSRSTDDYLFGCGFSQIPIQLAGYTYSPCNIASGMYATVDAAVLQSMGKTYLPVVDDSGKEIYQLKGGDTIHIKANTEPIYDVTGGITKWNVEFDVPVGQACQSYEGLTTEGAPPKCLLKPAGLATPAAFGCGMPEAPPVLDKLYDPLIQCSIKCQGCNVAESPYLGYTCTLSGSDFGVLSLGDCVEQVRNAEKFDVARCRPSDEDIGEFYVAESAQPLSSADRFCGMRVGNAMMANVKFDLYTYAADKTSVQPCSVAKGDLFKVIGGPVADKNNLMWWEMKALPEKCKSIIGWVPDRQTFTTCSLSALA